MRAVPVVVVALALLAAAAPPPGPAAAAADAEGIRVHVRVEGRWGPLGSVEVALGDTYRFTAHPGGRTHEVPARTPLGALHAAAEALGLPLAIDDQFVDLVVREVGGEAWWGAWWWDYRVDWRQTNYGAQAQWLAWGPELQDGAEVLWYPETLGSVPLRLGAPAPALPMTPGACAQAVQVEALLVDPLHQPGQPWPEVAWGPAPLVRLVAGPVTQPAPGGAAVVVLPDRAMVRAEEQPLALNAPHHPVRSAPLEVRCDAPKARSDG